MSKDMPERGDRVLVVLEGVVSHVGGGYSPYFYVGDRDGYENVVHAKAKHVVSIEVLPPPEPEWKPGDVVRDADGRVFWRSPTGHWLGVWGAYRPEFPTRPLTRLVPES